MKKKIKTVFIGTDAIGTRLLRSLHSDSVFDIELVITQPDRPAGRKLEKKASPIKSAARELGLEVVQPADINEATDLKARLKNGHYDLFVALAYGQLLKQDLLDLPSFACINIHASLLPHYRGASPIQNALLCGETKTGFSIMKMVRKMDAGPLFHQYELNIDPSDNRHTLSDKLSQSIAKKAPKDLAFIVLNHVPPVPQDESRATYCRKITKADGLIDWKETASSIHGKIRAFTDWPTAYTFFKSRRLVLHEAILHHFNKPLLPPGHVFRKEREVFIQTGKGCLEPVTLQIEGKNPQPLGDFINGHPDFINSVL